MNRYWALAVTASLLTAAATGPTTPTQQLEANKTVARRALAAIESGNLQELNALYEPDGIIHTSHGIQREHGPYTDLKTGFPMAALMDPRAITIDLLLAEGDLVTVRSTWRGKHAAEYSGVPPSGKELVMTYTNIFRIHDGRIAENWVALNQLALLEQLGLTVCDQAGTK